MAATTIPAFDATYAVAEADLCNIALSRIAVATILDTAEDTQVARACRRQYARTRDELLRDYEFNFAIHLASFEEDEDYEDLGPWTYAFDPPTGLAALRVLEVNHDPDAPFELRGAKLLANTYTTEADDPTPRLLEARIVERIINPALFDPLFYDALVLRLASKIAFPLTGKLDLAQVCQSEFAAVLANARIASSKERFDEAGETLWTKEGRG